MPPLPGNPIYVSVDEIFNEDNECVAFDAEGRHRTYQRRYLVVSRTKLAGPLAACAAPLLPLPYSSYFFGDGLEYDILAILTKRSAHRQNKDDWQNWIVTDEYSTRTRQIPDAGNQGHPGGGGSEGDPTLEWPEMEWSGSETNWAAQMDLESRPYLNSALQPFQPSPTVQRSRAVLTVVRNDLSWTAFDQQRWSYVVNRDKFLDYEPGRVMMMPPKAVLTRRGLFEYWKVTFTLMFHETVSEGEDCQFIITERLQGEIVETVVPGTYFRQQDPPLPNPLNCWQPCILDAGLCRLDDREKIHTVLLGDFDNPNFGKPVPIWRGTGMIHQPVCLDGYGQPSIKRDRNGLPDPKDGRIKPTYCVFKQYQEDIFHVLFDDKFRKPRR